MNVAMYLHPATQGALSKLKAWGVDVLATGQGPLACGDVGEGRLLEPDVIFEKIEQTLHPKHTAPQKRILITSGGTREALDGVRSITNTSTGRTGTAFAEAFVAAGFDVTFVHAEASAQPQTTRLTQTSFVSFADLEQILKMELATKSYDTVLHLAAVSDYSVDSVVIDGKTIKASRENKLTSEADAMAIQLKRNPKLVNRLREFSKNPDLTVIAFKLTNGADQAARLEAVRKLARGSHADFVIQNDLSEIDAKSQRHKAVIYNCASPENPAVEVTTTTKDELTRAVVSLAQRLIPRQRTAEVQL